MKKGIIRKNPFEDYEISMQETDRGYLLKEDVEKMMKYKLRIKGMGMYKLYFFSVVLLIFLMLVLRT